jgi:uncharacterized protein (DUF983 family)
MTARESRSIPGGPGGVVWSLIIVAASVVGGLAAAAFVRLPSIWIAVAIPAIIGPVVAQAVLYRRPGLEKDRGNRPGSASPSKARPEVPSGRTHGHNRGYEQPAQGQAATESAAVVQVLPAPAPAAPAADAPWWVSARAGPPPGRSSASPDATPDLSTYLASALIAQCPRCGAFKLDIKRAPAKWAFRCESCEHTWTWQPGTAWPQVRVAPRRRTQPNAPDPDSRDSAS